MFKKEFPIDKYKFYFAGNKVIAVSTYGGQRVRGVAVCSNEDEFDVEKGKALAAARCNLKVARKRYDRANAKYIMYSLELDRINRAFLDACNYYTDSANDLGKAERRVRELEESM